VWKKKIYVVEEIVYLVGLTAVRMSILFFYLRALGTTKATQLAIYFLIGFNAVYGTARLVSTSLKCLPTSPLNQDQGVCVTLQLSMTVVNTVVDLALLLFPMPIVWNLRIPIKQKLSICLIFCFGAL